MTKALLAAIGFAALIAKAHAQPLAPSAGPRFEVASIRRGCPGSEGSNGPPASWIDQRIPGRLSFCAILVNLIDSAYFHYAGGHLNVLPIRPPHIGDPAWFESDKYMLNAKAAGNPSQEMMRGPMLQALLEERFKLKVHWETKEVPVYTLTVAKGGAKLQPFKEGSCFLMDPRQGPPATPNPGPWCRNGNSRKGSTGVVDWRGLRLDQFAREALIGVVDRPAIDKTGIAGKFNFHLEFAPDQATPAFLPGGALDTGQTGAADPVGPSVFSAIQEQLGLKLVPAKGPRDFLVIDHVERPSEN
jgi:uncharacterized protein (TIGR03435 family)